MLHLGHRVVGILRLDPSPCARLAPATRGSNTAVCFSSNSATPAPSEREGERMDKSKREDKESAEKKDHGNIMSHSFGEGYSTRSDDDGFGGIYGGNQSVGNPSDVSHPEYDKTQGSEVGGKEKARNQPHATS